MVHDLTNHNRPDPGQAVIGAESVRALCNEMGLSIAGKVPAKCHARFSRAKGEALDVAGQIRVGVRGEQVSLVAFGTERETGLNAGVRIKISLGEHLITYRANN